jgi:hypothetical protein
MIVSHLLNFFERKAVSHSKVKQPKRRREADHSKKIRKKENRLRLLQGNQPH